MMVARILIFQLIGLCCVSIQAYTTYKECRVYAEDETISNYHDCQFCVSSDDTTDTNQYCREYSCAPTDCEDPVKSEYDCCGSCPGTCNYGGRIYNIGDAFLCLDGINYCSCIGTGQLQTTYIGYSHESVCRQRYYGACTMYGQWEDKDKFRQQGPCVTETISGRRVEVCKEYTCGWIHCEKPKNNAYDNCTSCPGTCNYAGRTYMVDDTFPCVDGLNVCQCIATGNISTAGRLPNTDQLCKTFGDQCVVYSPSEEKDPTKCRYCTSEYRTPWAQFCKEYTCAETTCDAPVASEYQCCASCPGTCNYGGKVYNVNDSWTCIDGVNYCGCLGTGSIMTTLVGGSKESLCFSK